jgi:hypothetical protein
MFIVRRIRRGLFSDSAFLEAVSDGVLTKRWLGWDRLGALTLRSEPRCIASGGVFTLQVPRGSLSECQTLSTDDVEAIDLTPLKRRKSS